MITEWVAFVNLILKLYATARDVVHEEDCNTEHVAEDAHAEHGIDAEAGDEAGAKLVMMAGIEKMLTTTRAIMLGQKTTRP